MFKWIKDLFKPPTTPDFRHRRYLCAFREIRVVCKCGRVIKTSPMVAEGIKKHGCWKCHKEAREKLDELVGTDD